MLDDLRTLPEPATLNCDICIIGAGAAGISLARELRNSALNVCVLESGGLEIDPAYQALVEADVVGFPYRHHATRCRVFGGSTARWGGQCGPLDDTDLEKRPWVDHSGWPLEKMHLDRHYDQAHDVLELTHKTYNPRFWDGDSRRLLDVGAKGMVNKIWQFSPPTDFGLAYREELESSTNIQVLLHANATEIVLDHHARTVQGVRVSTLDGKIGFVAARFVVLACGGIENARMLLLSNSVETNGIGNGRDLVGRYFADHPHQVAGQVEFAPGASREWVSAYKERFNHGARFRPGIGLTAAAQQDEQILNCAVHLCDWYATDTWNCTQSVGYRAVKALARLAAQPTAWAHLKNDLRSGRMPPGLGPIMFDLLTHPYGAAAGILNRMRGGSLVALTQSEQAPNPASRVSLSETRDRLGLPMARIDWRLQPIDKITIRRTIELLSQELTHLGVGRIRPFDWLTQDDETWLHVRGGGHHHMGTTRMGATPTTSVVDADCRVHGVENLYVAGSSVFPTTGFMNPTLTLIALTLRLADQLKKRLHDEPQVPLFAVAAE